MTKVYLTRHGQSEHNKKNEIQGQIDSKLTEKGRDQAKELAESLSNHDFDAIYSSDLKRAKNTAGIINQRHDLKLRETEKLRERDLGDLEGNHYTKWDDVEAEDHHNWRPENGESLKEHKDRAMDVLEEIKDSEDLEEVLIVAHGGTIRAMLMAILGCKSRQAWKIKLDNCSLTELRVTEDGWKIFKVGCYNV